MPKVVGPQDRELMRKQIIHAAAAEFTLIGFEPTH